MLGETIGRGKKVKVWSWVKGGTYIACFENSIKIKSSVSNAQIPRY